MTITRNTFKAAARQAVPALLAALLLVARVAVAAPFVYVANIGSDDVTVIDTATNSSVATIPVGDDPNGIAVTPDGTQAFVTNFNSEDVSIIDTRTQQVSPGTIAVGSGPVGIAITPDGEAAYVANKRSNTVTVLRTSPAAALTTIAVGDGPNAVAVSPDGKRVYVTNSFTSNPGTVSVIDTATNQVIDTIDVQRSPGRVAFTPDGALAYVTNFGSWTVSVIDTLSNTAVDTIPAFGRPSNVAVNPDNGQAYITTLGGRVQVIETGDQSSAASIDVGELDSGESAQPYAIATTRDGAVAYVANYAADAVAVMNLDTQEVVAQVMAGERPFAVAVSCVDAGCSAPPMTPRPTSTPTQPGVPTRSPTPTRIPTRSPTPATASVVIAAQAGELDANDDVRVEVRLDSGGHAVVGTQNDLVFDHTVVTLADESDCELNPALVETAPGCDDAEPSGACKTIARSLMRCDSSPTCGTPTGDNLSRLRAIVLSLGPAVNNPIPDGLLYTCRFHVIDPSRLPTTILMRNVFVSGPQGVEGGDLPETGRDTTITRAVAAVGVGARGPMGFAGAGASCAIDPDSGRISLLLLSPAVLLLRRRRR